MARNRYGWQKRAKEMARKEKNDEKMKRRQGKAVTPPVADLPETALNSDGFPSPGNPDPGTRAASARSQGAVI